MSETENSFKIWYTCDAKRKDGSIVKLRYQDLPLTRDQDANELILKCMLKDEAFHKAAGIYANEDAIEEYRSLLSRNRKNRFVIVCCVDNGTEYGGELVGLSAVGLEKLSRPFDKNKFSFQTKEMKTLFAILHAANNLTNLHTKFESHFFGKGIIVNSNYRGLGIANNFVRLRLAQCKEHNVPMTIAWMSAKGTQIAAEKNNWKVDVEIKPEELGKICGVQFEDNSIVFKHMYIISD